MTPTLASSLPRARNVGLTYNAHGLRAQINYDFRGKQKQGSFRGSGRGDDAFRYVRMRDYLDLNVEYSLRKNLSVFSVARNVTNDPQDCEAYGSQTPANARYKFGEEFGAQFNFGLIGTF